MNCSNRFAVLSSLPNAESNPCSLHMSAITKTRQTPSITLKTKLIGNVTGRQIDAEALLDSGAEGIILHPRFAERYGLTLRPLPRPFPVRNVDNSENVMGLVRSSTTQTLRIYSQNSNAYHQERVEFFVADIGDFDLILGTDWLHEHNPEIDWPRQQVHMTRCPASCQLHEPPVKNLQTATPPSISPTITYSQAPSPPDTPTSS